MWSLGSEVRFLTWRCRDADLAELGAGGDGGAIEDGGEEEMVVVVVEGLLVSLRLENRRKSRKRAMEQGKQQLSGDAPARSC